MDRCVEPLIHGAGLKKPSRAMIPSIVRILTLWSW